MARNRSNTEKKQRKMNPKSLENLQPLKPGFDPRRNMNGRPKSFDQLRNLFQDIASEEIEIQGKKYTRAQAIGIAMSMDKKLMREFLEFAYGKVPQAVTLANDPDNPLIPKIPDEERIERMKQLAVMIAQEVKGKDA